jgi:hypothetical protein
MTGSVASEIRINGRAVTITPVQKFIIVLNEVFQKRCVTEIKRTEGKIKSGKGDVIMIVCSIPFLSAVSKRRELSCST